MSPATLALVADPVLPQRDLLLDPAAMAGRLAAALGAAVEDCELVRAKYRVRESLRACYRLRLDGRERLVSARMFPAGRASREPAPAVPDPDLDTAYWVFPNDRRLPRPGWLDEVPVGLRDAFDEPWRHTVLAAYTPEKALTVRCLSGSGQVLGYAKAYHSQQAARAGTDPAAPDAVRSQAVLAGVQAGLRGAAVRVARPLGYRPEAGVALSSAVPGRPLSGTALTPGQAGLLGGALAALHRCPTGPLRAAVAVAGSTAPGAARLRPDRIRRAAELVGQALPDQARTATALAGRLAATAARPLAAPPVHLHGDVHPANLLLDGDRVGLVDLDQAVPGPAGTDLGPLLARLWLPPGTERTATPRHPDGLLAGAALLDGYGRDRPGDSELAWFAAAALLVERAQRAVSGVRPDALAAVPAVLAAAQDWLAGR